MANLSAVKARIIAAVRTNRDCDAEWLYRYVYGRRKRRPGRAALKAHIWQLRLPDYRN